MPSVLLTLAYDGTAFHGWAAQPGMRTVEDVLRGAIASVDPRATPPRGTSRTDAGVHAEGQRAAFDATLDIPPRGWVLALNQHLPNDVGARAAQVLPVAGFHPRFAAKTKRYRYRLLRDHVRDPLWRTRAWRVDPAVDLERMAKEAERLVGTHDFAAFRSSSDARPSTVRTLTRVAFEQDATDPRVVGIVVEGSAFLHNMVRILAGTLLEVGTGRKPEGTIALALENRLRVTAGTTAPAHGLTLEHVDLDVPPHAGESWPR